MSFSVIDQHPLPLPPEVIGEIALQASSDVELSKTCSLACKLFRDYFQPNVFRTISLDEFAVDVFRRKVVNLLDAITLNSDLRNYVKELIYMPMTLRIPQMAKLLIAFPSLVSFYFSSARIIRGSCWRDINKEIQLSIAHICRLPSLRSLTLYGCRDVPMASLFQAPNLTSLSLWHVTESKGASSIRPKTARLRHISFRWDQSTPPHSIYPVTEGYPLLGDIRSLKFDLGSPWTADTRDDCILNYPPNLSGSRRLTSIEITCEMLLIMETPSSTPPFFDAFIRCLNRMLDTIHPSTPLERIHIGILSLPYSEPFTRSGTWHSESWKEFNSKVGRRETRKFEAIKDVTLHLGIDATWVGVPDRDISMIEELTRSTAPEIRILITQKILGR